MQRLVSAFRALRVAGSASFSDFAGVSLPTSPPLSLFSGSPHVLQATVIPDFLKTPWVISETERTPLYLDNLGTGRRNFLFNVVKDDGVAVELPSLEEIDGGMECMKTKRTFYNPTRLHRKRHHGYLHRKSTPNGRRVLQRRLEKGRWYISSN